MGNEVIQQPAIAVQRRRRTKQQQKGSIPYAGATSGENARAEATKILRRLGCEQIGFMDDFENREVLLAFTHRGREHSTARFSKRLGNYVPQTTSLERPQAEIAH